ncbi:MAG: hypothetical protein CSA95_08000 [Bacteroidetes bacterium]|nr:MAG: hypothetical protein CSA95_08000 [Bacteroidota bacterium]
MKLINRFFMLMMLLGSFNLYAQQVDIQISVQPPYTPYINDYMANPNKVVVTLFQQNPANEVMEVYLHGELSSASGRAIFTRPDAKPSSPIQLLSGVPYQLSSNDFVNMYDPASLDYVGITEEEIIRTNLIPEDIYTICIQAFDYQTDKPVSAQAPMGCSNDFYISYIEPPLITSPACFSHLEVQETPSVYVSWTTPSGLLSSLGIYYRIRMVAIQEGEDLDPIDAVLNPNFASIYEAEIGMANGVLLTQNEIPFIEGNTYAFTVQVVDESHMYYFKNGGVSEPCWFIYGEEENPENEEGGLIIESLDDYYNAFQLIPETSISGRMVYKIPEENVSQTMSLQGNNPLNPGGSGATNTTFSYQNISHIALKLGSNANEITHGFNALSSMKNVTATPPTMQNSPPLGRGLIHQNSQSLDQTAALANTRVKLVATVAIYGEGAEFPSYHLSLPQKCSLMNIYGQGEGGEIIDLDGNPHNPESIETLNMVLAVTETDADGNFSFNFRKDFYSAPCLAKVMCGDESGFMGAEQTNPVNELWAENYGSHINPNPLSTIFQGYHATLSGNEGTLGNNQLPGNAQTQGGQQVRSLNVNISSQLYEGYICLKVVPENPKFTAPDVDIFAMPGDEISLGNQVVKLKTYNARITVKTSNDRPQFIEPGSGIEGAMVEIYRKKDDCSNEHPIILQQEGEKLDSYTINQYGALKDVSFNTTSSEGTVTITNLVKYWKRTDGYPGPYLIDIKTRKNESTQYENTLYNYQSRFELFNPDNYEEMGDIMIGYDAFSENIIEITHNYKPYTLSYEYTLSPIQPEIKGRVMTSGGMENISVPNAKVLLITQNDNLPLNFNESLLSQVSTANYWFFLSTRGLTIEDEFTTGPDGVFRFTDLPITYNEEGKTMGPYRRVLVLKEGYVTQLKSAPAHGPANLTKGQLFDLRDINLEPSDHIYGHVEDEWGNAVQAYVRLAPDGPYHKSVQNYQFQEFYIGARKSDNTVEIEPLSTQYFTETVTNVAANGDDLYPARFLVYKRLHRLRIQVTLNNTITPIPVSNANICIGDSLAYGTTNENGIFECAFASPDKHFLLKITAPGQAPHQEILASLPSKTFVNKSITLYTGKTVQGIVKNKDTGSPIHDATIYATLQNTDGHPLYIETKSDESGQFQLEGVPMHVASIKVHVNKSGKNPSYVGTYKEVIPGTDTVYTFTLKAYENLDLTEFMGFPIRVEEMKPIKASKNLLISGYLYNIPSIPGYRVQDEDLRVPFRNFEVTTNKEGKLIPVLHSYPLDAYKIPIRIHNTFVGNMGKPYLNLYGSNKLQLEKLDNSMAQIRSGVKLDLESFRFAYNFGGDFYMGDDSSSYKTTVFKSTGNGGVYSSTTPRRLIFDLDTHYKPTSITGYSVLGFSADSDMGKSFIQEEEIRLSTILHPSIPLGNSYLKLAVPVGDIVIKQKEIGIEKTPAGALNFDLEKWHITSKKRWQFDMNEEAIVLPEVLIHSDNGISATVKGMRLRPDAICEGRIELSDGLSLGGFKKIEITPGLEPLFNYDASVGHYRISVVGSYQNGDVVARVRNLPHTNNDLLFESIGMLSNDEKVYTLKNNRMRFYNVLDVAVNQIMTGDGYFILAGQPDIGVQNFIATDTKIKFEKNKDPVIQQLDGQINCSNDVSFILEDPKIIQHNYLELNGYNKVSPSTLEEGSPEGDSFKLDAILHKRVQGKRATIDIEVKPNAKFYNGNKYLIVTDGGMDYKNHNWSHLAFNAHPCKEGGQEGLSEEDNLHFEVAGAVSVSGDEINVNNMSDQGGDSPFSGINLSYNFKEQSLFGSMNIGYVELGYASLLEGTMQMLFSPKGFYFGSMATIEYNKTPFDGGVLIGYTSQNLTKYTIPLLHKFKAEGSDRPNFSSGLRGFYLIGQKPFLDDKSIDLVVAEASIDAGVGVWINCNFATEIFKIGGYGYFDASISILCFKLHQHTYCGVSGGYEGGSLSYSGCGTALFEFKACLKSVSKQYSMSIHNGSVHLGEGGCP